MIDEANKPLDASELTENDLQQVAGGSTPTATQKLKVVDILPTPTEPTPGKVIASWDIAANKSS